jgi:hypothetical protein
MNTDIECKLSGPETPECFQLRIGEQVHNLHAWQLISLLEAVNLIYLHWLGLTRIDIIRSHLELDQREKLSQVLGDEQPPSRAQTPSEESANEPEPCYLLEQATAQVL